MKFRHKPVEVDAFVLTKAADARAPDWFIDAVREEHILIDRKLVVDHVEVYGCTIYGKMQRIHVNTTGGANNTNAWNSNTYAPIVFLKALWSTHSADCLEDIDKEPKSLAKA